MKGTPIVIAGLVCLTSGACLAQSMFRGGPTHTGVYAGPAPRAFHRIKWKFPTGDRIVSSPVWSDGAIYFGGDDGNIYAVEAESGRQLWKRTTGGPVSSTPAVSDGVAYAVSYHGKLYALDAKTGGVRWKFTTGGERRFEAKGLHGLQPKNQTIADPFDTFLSSPVVAQGAVYFGSGDSNLYAVDAAAGKEKWRFHGGEDPTIRNQVGFQSSPAVVDGVVYTGCRDAQLYALGAATGKEKWRVDNALSWVIASPAVSDGKVYYATSDSSLYQVVEAATGKPILKQQDKCYMFSSPAIAGDVVLIGVLNGTLEARDLKTGEVLWNFETETSKQNNNWVLTKDRRFNDPLLFHSNWREAPIVAADRQFAMGAIFSSPLIANGVVYFGSTDGYPYALE